MSITVNKPSGRPGETLLSLQAGRGLAAFAVVLHHAGQASDAFADGHWGHLFEWGYLGVDFFFILSGFIIFHAHGADPRTLSAAKRFTAKRLRRIYLPYLPISFALILAYQLMPELSQAERSWGWLTSVTLLPSGHPPALSVAWTLVFEMCFYGMFLISYFKGVLVPVAVLWAAAVLSVWGFGIGEWFPKPIADYFLHPLVLEFLLGMVAAWAYSRVPSSQAVVWLALGVIAGAVFFCFPEAHRVFFGVALAPFVLGLALIGREQTFRLPAALIFLGSASYALYLVHNPLMSVVARVASVFDSWTATFVLCCLSALLAGVAYHWFYERPVLRWTGRFVPPLGRKEGFSDE